MDRQIEKVPSVLRLAPAGPVAFPRPAGAKRKPLPTLPPGYNDGMDYDSRYLAGIVLFNRGDFFEAHEVWELWWMDTFGPEKLFGKGVIRAAVGLSHFCNGNLSGAVKLYQSSREYMLRYGSPYLGLDQNTFWG